MALWLCTWKGGGGRQAGGVAISCLNAWGDSLMGRHSSVEEGANDSIMASLWLTLPHLI